MTESIVLIAACPQVRGNIKHYKLFPGAWDVWCSVCERRRAVYGFARSGRYFIMSFADWLIMNKWLTVPEVPASQVLWHDGDDAGAIKRTIKAREYVVSEERAGRNVLVMSAETFSAEPLREEWSLCTRFDVSFAIARLARIATRWSEWARKEIRHILGFCLTLS